MPKAESNAVDKSIGSLVKFHRKQARISQTALGKHLGVTFQQVQKYENGTNKLAAATLYKIGLFLSVLLDELTNVGNSQAARLSRHDIIRFAQEPEGRSLLLSVMAIQDTALRQRIVEFVEAAGRKRA